MKFQHINPGDASGRGGGGPEDDRRYPEIAARTHGLVVLAFGLALGITFLLFYGWFNLIPPQEPNIFTTFVLSIEPQYWITYFLYGFIAGVIIATIYNVLVVNRISIFGTDISMD
jgi:hypothetical protein